MVTKLDRLARSVRDAHQIADDLAAREVKLSIAGSVYDPTDPMGKLLFNVLAMVAEFEADLIRVQISARVNAGIAAAKASGTRFGRPPVRADVVAEKLEMATGARAKGKTATQAAELVGWSRATLYRHQSASASQQPMTPPPPVS